MAQLGFTHQNTIPNTLLSNWHLPVPPRIAIGTDALNYFIENKAGNGFAALFIDRHNYLISHRVYLFDTAEVNQIMHDAAALHASKLYIALHTGKVERKALISHNLYLLLRHIVAEFKKRKIDLRDLFEIGPSESNSALLTFPELFIC